MKIVAHEAWGYVLNLTVGDEVLAELKRLAEIEQVPGATFTGIGLADTVEVGWYDVKNKKYETQTYQEPLEIAVLQGNIARDEHDGVVIHAHGVFAKRDHTTIGGHVMQAKIGAAGEVVVHVCDTPLLRIYNDDLGLSLLSP